MHAPPRYQPGQLVPGTSLRVVRHLGDGGMGSVFEVIETSVDAPFVMKIVHPQLVLANRGTVAQRMSQEARIMARLNHRNIVRVYRAGLTAEDPPLPFYVADRLTGYTVRQFLSWHQRKGIAVPISWAFWIGASLFAALEHAHAEGAIHRDVKPENLFVHQPAQERPAIKLLDFGVVAVLSDLAQGERLTHGGFAGTPTHAAPEQLRGATAAPSMDLYAAGVVLFELLAGVHPFPNCRSFDTLAQAHLYEAPAPLRQYRSSIHPSLESFVYQLLAKDPASRPKNAHEALVALRTIKSAWIQQGTISGTAPGLQFDVDMADPLVRDMERDVGFAIESRDHGARQSRPAASGEDAPLVRASLGRGAETAGRRSNPNVANGAIAQPVRIVASGAPTPAMWTKTIAARGGRSAKAVVVLAAGVILVGAAGTAAYRILAPAAAKEPPPSTSTMPIAEPAKATAVIVAPSPATVTSGSVAAITVPAVVASGEPVKPPPATPVHQSAPITMRPLPRQPAAETRPSPRAQEPPREPTPETRPSAPEPKVDLYQP